MKKRGTKVLVFILITMSIITSLVLIFSIISNIFVFRYCKIDKGCGHLIGIDCHSEDGGPYYYVNKFTGKIVSYCGGYCEEECIDCPPKEWSCD